MGAERCQHLNWNGQYFDSEWDAPPEQTSARVFWCQHTHNCLGPDGQVADREACVAGRECYRAL